MWKVDTAATSWDRREARLKHLDLEFEHGTNDLLRTHRRGVELHSVLREGVRHRIGDHDRRRNRASLADTLNAQWIKRRREVHMDQIEVREFACVWTQVIHERAPQQLSPGVVAKLLEHRTAQALHEPAMYLSVDEHWIHDRSAVMDDDVFLDLKPAERRIDLDDRRMCCVGPRDCRRFEVCRFFQTCGHAGGPTVIPARASRFCDVRQRDFLTRYAEQTDSAIPQLEIVGRALKDVGGDCEDLLA